MNLKIGYLGKRDYIDVSTLSTALYEALPNITTNNQIKNFDIRLIKKVTNECELILYEDQMIKTKPDRTIAVVFNWEFQGKKYTAFFKEKDQLLTNRFAELVDDPKDHMRYENSEVILFNPINDDCIYNLMKMGRLIVVNKYHKIPRVVRFHFDHFYDKIGLKDVKMTAGFYAEKDFYKLETFKNGTKFGEIIVKGLEFY